MRKGRLVDAELAMTVSLSVVQKTSKVITACLTRYTSHMHKIGDSTECTSYDALKLEVCTKGYTQLAVGRKDRW